MADKNTESKQNKNQNIEEDSDLQFLKWAINKIINNDYQFTPDEHIRAYSVVYNMCLPDDGAEEVYKMYKNIFEDYVSSEVLPHLRGKNGEILLKEVVQQWDKYTTLHKRVFRLFHYLENYFTPRWKLPSLLETSHLIVYNLVHTEMEDQLRLALESEINRERNGEEIDTAVMKKVMEIYEEMDKVINASQRL